MAHAYRVLRIAFESRGALDREYFTNLVNGALFIPGHFDLLDDEPVMVFVDLPFVGGAIELEGCVAQSIPLEFEVNGGRCGVALELRNSPDQIRRSLEAAIDDALEDDSRLGGKRVAPRSVTEVRVRVCIPGAAEREGWTRNLSLAGVLVSISGEMPDVGQEVSVTIMHPKSGEERSIPGFVARQELDAQGWARGVGIQFVVGDADLEETGAFLHRVKASEHARRLGRISGSISMLGLGDLLTSFGRCFAAGRFTLTKDGEVGTIQIKAGRVGRVQVGATFGIKALVRMIEWEDGNFEFDTTPEPDREASGLSMPIEVALLEVARLVDESRRTHESGLPVLVDHDDRGRPETAEGAG